MKLFDWYKDVKAVLEAKPEEWLAYLPGQTIERYKPLLSKPTKYQGVVLQTLIFFWHLFGFWNPKRSKLENVGENAIWMYAGSHNQLVSLDKVAEVLRNEHQKIICTLKLNKKLSSKGFSSIRLSTVDVLKIVFLFFTRALPLLFRLKKNNKLGVKYFYGSFLSCYIYLVVFQRIITVYRPKLILVANDHNVDCRSLIFMAKRLGIKTAYLQHASVSDVFPALSMDYAFLDGQAAKDIYDNCKINSNYKEILSRFEEGLSGSTRVYLTGQQKNVKVKALKRSKIGVAVNAVDTLERVIDVVRLLVEKNEEVIVRWHPRQAPSDIQYLRNEFQGKNQIKFSDSEMFSVFEFFSDCKAVIAGNSSILLEAALSGASPIYYRFDRDGMEDYYGFCKQGLARDAKDVVQLVQYLGNTKLTSKQIEAVKYYSSTFKTEWEGKEFELVGNMVTRLIEKNIF